MPFSTTIENPCAVCGYAEEHSVHTDSRRAWRHDFKPDKAERKPRTPDEVQDALEQLCCYVTNGAKRYESRNPYGVPAIQNALRVLAKVNGRASYFDVLDGVEPRFNEE